MDIDEKIDMAIDNLIRGHFGQEFYGESLRDEDFITKMKETAQEEFTFALQQADIEWQNDLGAYKSRIESDSLLDFQELEELKDRGLGRIDDQITTMEQGQEQDDVVFDAKKDLMASAKLEAVKIVKPKLEQYLESKINNELSATDKVLRGFVANLKSDPKNVALLDEKMVQEIKAIIEKEYSDVMDFKGVDKMNVKKLQATKDKRYIGLANEIREMEKNLEEPSADNLKGHAKLAGLKAAKNEYGKVMTNKLSQAKSKSISGRLHKFVEKAKKAREGHAERRRSSREIKIEKEASKGPPPPGK